MSNDPDGTRTGDTQPSTSGAVAVQWRSLAALGVMISPYHLVLSVNLAGEGGLLAIFLLVAAAGWYGLALRNCRWAIRTGGEVSGPVGLQAAAFGPTVAIGMNLVSRLLTALLLLTTLPVAAGFVFNEVFVYWFPNFGFAFLLLAVLAVIHFFAVRLALRLQQLLIGCVIAGLAVVALSAFIWGPSPGALPLALPTASPAPLLAGLLVLAACDLAITSTDGENDRENGGRLLPSIAVGTLFFAALLLAVFAAAAMAVVPASRLADSTIPHMLMARAAMGQNGRLLMGAVVIAGAAAAVNGLLLVLPSMLAEMAGIFSRSARGAAALCMRRLTVPAVCGAAAGLMAAGLAGSEYISRYLAAALLMWVLQHGSVQLAIVRLVLAGAVGGRLSCGDRKVAATAAALSATAFAAVIALVWGWPLLQEMARWMVVAAGTAFAFSLVIGRLVQWRRSR